MGDDRLTLPPLGFGAFKIGRNEGTKYPHAYDLPDEAAVDRLLNAVLDLGIGYIDTAPAYGLSEERIGHAISHRRDEFVLSTKVGEQFAEGKSTYDFSEEAVRRSVERSLTRLRTEILDLVLIHAHRDDVWVINETDVVPTLGGLKERGLIRHVGLSAYTADGFDAAWPWADAIMVEYHPENRALEPTIAAAAKHGVRVVVKKPLASGRLDPAAAIRFALANADVDTVVVGTLNLDHLRENVRVAGEARPA